MPQTIETGYKKHFASTYFSTVLQRGFLLFKQLRVFVLLLNHFIVDCLCLQKFLLQNARREDLVKVCSSYPRSDFVVLQN